MPAWDLRNSDSASSSSAASLADSASISANLASMASIEREESMHLTARFLASSSVLILSSAAAQSLRVASSLAPASGDPSITWRSLLISASDSDMLADADSMSAAAFSANITVSDSSSLISATLS